MKKLYCIFLHCHEINILKKKSNSDVIRNENIKNKPAALMSTLENIIN